MASAYPAALDTLPTSHVDNVGEAVKALDINNLADAVNRIEAFVGLIGNRQVIDLVSKYGVSTSAAPAANAAAMQAAFTVAAATGAALYLRGAPVPYPVTTLTLPSEPIMLFGDDAMASVFSTTSATILTYSKTTAPLTGVGDPFSVNATSLGGTGAAVHYRSKMWQIEGIGFTKSDNWSGNAGVGLDFPNWSGVSNGLVMWMKDVVVSNFNGTGINFQINGCRQESVFVNVLVDGCKGVGTIYNSDQWWIGCHSNNCGFEGYWNDGGNAMLVSCKAYSNGVVNGTSRNAGFYYQNQSDGAQIVACYAQDNFGPGLQLHNAQGVIVDAFTAERNCQNGGTLDATKQAAALLEDCKNVTINGLNATDSSTGRTNPQIHALRVTNTGGTTCQGNHVQLQHYQTSQALTDPVDPASDLNGTRVIVNAGDGGEIALAFVAAGFTPDPYKAQTQVVGTLTANMSGSIAVPTYAHKGARLRFKFTQDGTGGRTLTWAAGYKQAFSATGNTAGKVTIAEFEYDGTNWVQVGSNVWV